MALDGPDGICDPAEEALGHCFTSPSGFVVEIVCGPDGEFPVINDDGNSVFAYQVSGPGYAGGSCSGVVDVSHSTMLIPDCAPNPLVVLGGGPEGDYLPDGDPSCGFGGTVFKWDMEVLCDGMLQMSLVIEGVRAADFTEFLLKSAGNCDVGMILGPDCEFERVCEGTEGCPCGNNIPTGEAGCANSTGEGAILSASGSADTGVDDLVVTATGLPTDVFALFLAAEGAAMQLPLGDGNLCIGGPGLKIIRYLPAVNSGPMGQVDLGPGIVALSCGGTLGLPEIACIDPGETWYFQAWYRDNSGPCGSGVNVSSALGVTFH